MTGAEGTAKLKDANESFRQEERSVCGVVLCGVVHYGVVR